MNQDRLAPITVFKGAGPVLVEVRQSPFRIQNGELSSDWVHRESPESAGLAVKLAVTAFCVASRPL